MIEKVNEFVSVLVVFDSKKKKVIPKRIYWKGRVYKILKVGLHHKYRQGRILFHIFSVSTKGLFFRLKLDTESLFWKVEQITDGLAN